MPDDDSAGNLFQALVQGTGSVRVGAERGIRWIDVACRKAKQKQLDDPDQEYRHEQNRARGDYGSSQSTVTRFSPPCRGVHASLSGGTEVPRRLKPAPHCNLFCIRLHPIEVGDEGVDGVRAHLATPVPAALE